MIFKAKYLPPKPDVLNTGMSVYPFKLVNSLHQNNLDDLDIPSSLGKDNTVLCFIFDFCDGLDFFALKFSSPCTYVYMILSHPYPGFHSLLLSVMFSFFFQT